MASPGGLADSDEEDILPPAWDERCTSDGRIYYANHQTKSTQWSHPRTGRKKKVAGELPFGWERRIAEDGKVLFIDHINKKTTYTDPRIAFAVEEKESIDDFRQKFDGSSTAENILLGRDLSTKVVIVTGGNCGIGFETAKSLSQHGATVIIACRNMEKALAAVENIQKSSRHPAKIEAMALDLCSLRSVWDFANEFKAKNLPLHILILNAGVFGIPHNLTEDGYEEVFQASYLSHYYLAKLLEEKLVYSAPSRVVVLSSESHRFSNLSLENITATKLSPSVQNFVSMSAYNQAKLCCVLLSNIINSRLITKGVTSNAVHPGNMVSSSIQRNWWLYRLLFAFVRPFTKSLSQAASTTVYCAVDSELEGVGGLYFNNCCRCMPSQAAQDEQLATKLEELTEEMLNKVIGSWGDNRT